MAAMEERIDRPATSHSDTTTFDNAIPGGSKRRFESPTIQEISICCEISAYAPDGDDRPLF